MIPAILTLIAIGLIVGGVRSLASLRRIDEPADAQCTDPFYTSVALLFSTAPRNAEFRAVQRRTIWLFCGAILLLYIARASLFGVDGLN